MTLPSDLDPEVLLARVRAGDRSVLGPLLELYRNYLFLFVRVQVGDRLKVKIDAEDLVQEVFLEAHRRIDGFQGDSSGELLAWLRQIVAGVLANQVRRYYGTKRRDVRLEQALGSGSSEMCHGFDRALVAPGTSPSQRASRREQVVLLADALATLPADYREVIILRQLEDLPFPEVARRMGRTVDSVKNLWVRGLARLRRELDIEP
jgi:RNA polymerase sigma-70 factor (ECF subfamily)